MARRLSGVAKLEQRSAQNAVGATRPAGQCRLAQRRSPMLFWRSVFRQCGASSGPRACGQGPCGADSRGATAITTRPGIGSTRAAPEFLRRKRDVLSRRRGFGRQSLSCAHSIVLRQSGSGWKAVADRWVCPHADGMFVVTEADAAAIRAVYQQRGEFAAAVELRRRFPGITDNAQARECARTIAGWNRLLPVKRLPKPPRLRRVR